MESQISVREFYRGRSVLVTGGTGFMGKVLLEKLLHSVPDVGAVYLLVRPKRGQSVAQRLHDMRRSPLFDRLRKENPAALDKIKPLQGDVLSDELGLSERELERLSDEVSVLFHLAATLKLEAPLRDNVALNTGGTRRALRVARRLRHLRAFVHLSTAFCYPDYELLEETTHAPPVSPSQVLQLLEWLDDRQLALLTPSLLGAHPNCYTFSKRLAESVVKDEYENLPAVIVRPSIVCPAHEEPVPGWVDSLNGPIGLMIGAGKGVIRSMLCDGSLVAQVVPVDTAINALLAIGAIEGSRTDKPEAIPVYNVNIGHQKATTWGEVIQIGKDYGREFPLAWPLWYPGGGITTSAPLHEFRRLVYHLLPAYCIDLLLFLLGQKRLMVRIQERISKGLEVLQYFTMRPWHFACANFDGIQARLRADERVLFNTDLTRADRALYMRRCVEGGRIYCLKEDPANIPLNRAYHCFLFVLDAALKILFWLLVLSYLAAWFRPVRALLALGAPVIGYLPILGRTVLDD
ncbi:putative fatty acyl-CoA reductase CG5065 [Maniola jurtina]|uniref:putative fatty acyl-CoA reductase CG5065 n=1 Tax=Maniola jurtina TaxID=191418 RepID=UPI001E686A64|nr:putative fatty acyl-CoA reductase CG5065 [Maniola jurtina]